MAGAWNVLTFRSKGQSRRLRDYQVQTVCIFQGRPGVGLHVDTAAAFLLVLHVLLTMLVQAIMPVHLSVFTITFELSDF